VEGQKYSKKEINQMWKRARLGEYEDYKDAKKEIFGKSYK
jgi:hypothetical protein